MKGMKMKRGIQPQGFFAVPSKGILAPIHSVVKQRGYRQNENAGLSPRI